MSTRNHHRGPNCPPVIGSLGGVAARALCVCILLAGLAVVVPDADADGGDAGIGQPGWYALVPAAIDGGSSVAVNAASGDLIVSAPDLTADEASSWVGFSRSYNSLSSADVDFGVGWSLDVGPDVYLVPGSAGVTVHGPDGYVETLSTAPGGSFSAPVGFDGSLVQTSSGYVLTRGTEGDQWDFDASGALTGTADAGGRVFTVQSTSTAGNTLLASYGTASGQRISVSYDGNARIREIDDPSSNHYVYGYDSSGHLTSVQDPTGTTSYDYDAAGVLDGISFPGGETVAIVSDSTGRATSLTVTSAGGSPQTTTFAYSSGQTLVSAPDGQRTTYAYDGSGHATVSPTSTALPSLTGSTTDGQQLTAAPGAWSGTTPSYGYQWQRCDAEGTSCVAVSGATAQTYGLTSADVGSTLNVVVTASNAAGSASATAPATPVVQAIAPRNTDLPSISGTATEGEALTASNGTWTGSAPLGYGYQWSDCSPDGQSCQAIQGATGQSYRLVGADVGETLKVTVTAANAALPGGSSTSADSSATDVIASSTGCETWTGAAGDGSWATAGNWSTGEVPGLSSSVCLPDGSSVTIGDTAEAASVQADGASLEIRSGSLRLEDPGADSTIGTLTLDGGNLENAGTLTISAALSWTIGALSGSGITTIAPIASATIDPSGPDYSVTLDGQTLRNEGTVQFSCDDNGNGNNGTITGADGAGITNEASFTVGDGDSGEQCLIPRGNTATEETFVNTGTLNIAAPTAQINWEFSNAPTGTVSGDAGALALTGGQVPGDGEAGNWSVMELVLIGGRYDLAADADVSTLVVGVASWDIWKAVGTYLIGIGGVEPFPQAATLSTPAASWPGTEMAVEGGNVALTDPHGTSAIPVVLMAGPGTSFEQEGQLESEIFSGALYDGPDINADLNETFAAPPVLDGSGTTTALISEAPLQIDHQILVDTEILLAGLPAYIPPEDSYDLSGWHQLSVLGGDGATIKSYGTTLDEGYANLGGTTGGLLYDGSGERPSFVNEQSAYLEGGGYNDDGQQLLSEDDWNTANYGYLDPSQFAFGDGADFHNFNAPQPWEEYGPNNPAEPDVSQVSCGDPVDCGTGNLSEQETDFADGGLGSGLAWQRTYNSQLAASQSAPGAMGYGWTTTLSDSLVRNDTTGTATVYQAGGSAVAFTMEQDGTFSAPAWVEATLTQDADGTYTFTLPGRSTDTFDAHGRMLAQTDRNGNATTLGYDAAGELTQVTDPSGRMLTLSYNGGFVSSVTDPLGRAVHYSYDDAGNLVRVWDAAGTRWQFGYDSSHQLTTKTDSDGATVTNTYNTTEQVTAQTYPDGGTRTWQYDDRYYVATGGQASGPQSVTPDVVATLVTSPAGRKTDYQFANGEPTQITTGYGTSAAATTTIQYNYNHQRQRVTDPDGNSTQYGYDQAGDVTYVQDPLGNTTFSSFDGSHDVLSKTDPTGHTTSYGYDANGNVTSISRYDWDTGQTPTSSNTYDAEGERTSSTDADGDTSSFTYTPTGKLASETDPAGDETTYTYDAANELLSTVAPAGNAPGGDAAAHTTTYSYDLRGQQTSTTDPLGHSTTYTFDPSGRTTSVTGPDASRTSYTYDPNGDLTTTTRPDGTTITATYDADGNLTAQTNGSGQTTSYAYDAQNHVTSTTDPLGHARTYAYDLDGNRTSVTNAAGHATTFAYDADSRLTTISYSDGSTPGASFAYNAAGQQISMTDGTGTSTSTFNALGQLASLTNGAGSTVSYGYDPAGNQTSITYPNDQTVSRGFDAAGRMTSVTDWQGNTTNFAYTPDSQVATTSFPSGTGDVDTYSYDPSGAITAVTMAQGTADLATLSYSRDAYGELAGESQTGLPGPASATYTYDDLGALTSDGSTGYAYDAAGNATTFGGTSGYTYDQSGELTGTPDTSYGYNDLGQRTASTPDGAGATAYDYDQAGRLTTYAPPTGVSTTYAYDGNGLRASATGGSNTRSFTWDQNASLPLLLSDGAASYIYGPDNVPVEQISADGTISYLHHDQLGSTRLITDQDGAIAASLSYTAYGAPAGRTGSASTSLGYAGQYTDPETGFQYDRARYYDPATGQFLTQDPLNAATGQPYLYGADSPLDTTDPTGQFGLDDILSVGTAIAADVGCAATVEIPGVDAATCDAAADADVAAADDLAGAAGSDATSAASDATTAPDDPGAASEPQVADEQTAAEEPTSEDTSDASEEAPPEQTCAIHGNSVANPATSTLYRLTDTDTGDLLKWGISKNPLRRYTSSFLQDKGMSYMTYGSRREMLNLERWIVERDPGPLNREPWAGSRLDDRS